MIEKKVNNISTLQFANMPTDKLQHFSTTRLGGVSTGIFSSLNLGNFTDDNAEHIHENRRRLLSAIGLPGSKLFDPYQVHGSKVLEIDRLFLEKSSEQQAQLLQGVDGLITAEKGVCIGVKTADCVPIILYDSGQHVLAAIHAGWRGTAARITAKAVEQMGQQFGSNPKDIRAGIGPSISPRCFEVGEEIGEAFAQAGFDIKLISHRNTNTGKLHINLWEANRQLLLQQGVADENIEIAGLCTFTDAERFFSARRQTIRSGRMLTGGYLL